MGIASSNSAATCAKVKILDETGSQDSDSTIASLDEIRKELNIIKNRSLSRLESIEDRAERYIQRLNIPVSHLKLMVDSFVNELEVGLLAHKRHPNEWIPSECSFKMLDACISTLPTGQEKGTYFAIDFGGTTIRVVKSELCGNGVIKTSKYSKILTNHEEGKLTKGLLSPQATATELFDFIATTVKEFLIQEKENTDKEILAGFTFSFPCNQNSINTAKLVYWTKGFTTGRETDDPVEGQDVVELLNVAFKRNAVPVCCNAVLNDTTGTLLSCSYSMDSSKYPLCLIGLILGTGMNCCYYDDSAPEYGYQGNIINLECGNFNRDLPRLNVDCEIDFKSIDTRGVQQTEKMCSGAYLGEIARLIVVRILAEAAPPMAWQAFSLSTEVLFRIADDKSEDFSVTTQEIKDIWHAELSLLHVQILKRVATATMYRSSAIAAVLIAGCAKRTKRLQPAFGGLSVAIDGALYTKNEHYRNCLRHNLDMILGDLSSLIHLLVADDGSGKGASILAAII